MGMGYGACGGCPVPAFDAQAMPQICQMLYREGEAWRALLALHSGVVSTAQQVSALVTEATSLDHSEAGNATEHRELQYCAALTQLAATCDALHMEAIKLRGLRKARAAADIHAIQALMDAHANETLAVGASLSSNSSMAIQTVTADVRNAIQATRSQLAQSRALLDIVQNAPALCGTMRIGIVPRNGGTAVDFSTDAVFAAVYKRASELSEESLAMAMNDLMIDSSATPSSDATDGANAPAAAAEEPPVAIATPAPRTIPRRTGDRQAGSHR